MSASPDITLEIDTLELEGVAPAERFRVMASLERELGRLLRERGLPPGFDPERARPRELSLPELPASSTPEQLGHRLAQGLWAAL